MSAGPGPVFDASLFRWNFRGNSQNLRAWFVICVFVDESGTRQGAVEPRSAEELGGAGLAEVFQLHCRPGAWDGRSERDPFFDTLLNGKSVFSAIVGGEAGSMEPERFAARRSAAQSASAGRRRRTWQQWSYPVAVTELLFANEIAAPARRWSPPA